MALQPVRGTRDLLPEESLRYRHLTATARRIAALYGFGEIATPVFEFTDVFKRNLGDTTDVVTKEMYTFDDRGGADAAMKAALDIGAAMDSSFSRATAFARLAATLNDLAAPAAPDQGR